jgi:hypothetical protein
MYRFMDVPVRTAGGGVGTHDPAAGESLSVREAPARLVQRSDGSAVVLPDAAGTRPGEARAR